MGWTSLPVFVCDASGEIVQHESVKEFSTTPLHSVSQGQAWQRPCIDNTACAKVVSAMTELQSWLAQLLGTAVTSGNTGGECLQHKRTKQRKHRLVGRQGKASLRLRCNRLLFVGRCLHSPHLQQDYTSSFVIFEPALNRFLKILRVLLSSSLYSTGFLSCIWAWWTVPEKTINPRPYC